MGLDSTSQLASIINGGLRETQSVKESYADQGDASFILAPFESLRVSGELVVTKRVYSSDSFVVDHPSLGVVDSSVLLIDGGYDSSQDVVLVDKKF